MLLREVVYIDQLRSGMIKGRKQIDAVQATMRGEHAIRVGKREYEIVKRLNGKQLERGMKVLASHNQFNQGVNVFEILGVSDVSVQYGEGGVAYQSVKATLIANDVKTLKALEAKDDKNEYGYSHHLWVRDLENNEKGPWVYLFEGRWSVGSGAEALSFSLLKRSTQEVPPAEPPEKLPPPEEPEF